MDQKLVDQIDKRVAAGETKAAIFKSLDLRPASYYAYKAKQAPARTQKTVTMAKKKVKQPKFIDLPSPAASGKVTVIVCEPAQLASVLRGLT